MEGLGSVGERGEGELGVGNRVGVSCTVRGTVAGVPSIVTKAPDEEASVAGRSP